MISELQATATDIRYTDTEEYLKFTYKDKKL